MLLLLICCGRLALELAQQADIALPTTAAANSSYLGAMEAGHGDDDFCAVYKALK